jgi:hypothetical protein
MMAAVTRAALALAVSCLGDHRREWALAMEVEFEEAREDGKPLTFALGCLLAACRDLPAHDEGRLAIASHVLAFVLVIPMAALLVASLLAGFPFSYLEQIGTGGWLEVSGGEKPLFSDANRSAVPPLAAFVVLLAGSHLRMAWLVVKGDWARVAAVGMLIAAATMALVIFTSIVFVHSASALAQAAMLAIELASISALARWHARSLGGSARHDHA